MIRDNSCLSKEFRLEYDLHLIGTLEAIIIQYVTGRMWNQEFREIPQNFQKVCEIPDLQSCSNMYAIVKLRIAPFSTKTSILPYLLRCGKNKRYTIKLEENQSNLCTE